MIVKKSCAEAQYDKGAYSSYLAQRDCITCKSEENLAYEITFISRRKSTAFPVILNKGMSVAKLHVWKEYGLNQFIHPLGIML